MDSWLVVTAAVAYAALLFAVAYWGDRRGDARLGRHAKAGVYALSLAVYCTSWTFFGAVGSAASSGWDYLPIYLGPILVFTVGLPLVRRMVAVGKAQHATSIADFISARYGKSELTAALIAMIAVVAALPYIALQLRSVAMSFDALTNDGAVAAPGGDAMLIVALTLAAFAILFGTRQPDMTEPNRGLILAVALESAVKLFALCAVAAFSLVVLGAVGGAGAGPAAVPPSPFAGDGLDTRFVTLTVLAMAAILCLPRQFHVTVVECRDQAHVRTAGWLFTAYLVLTSVVVIPITLAGLAVLGAAGTPDLFVLQLPMARDMDLLALLVFLGGFSAATGMAIVACLALSNMITNDLVVPLLLRRAEVGAGAGQAMGPRLLAVRRAAIVVLMLLAYVYGRGIQGAETLAGLGVVSFAAVIQFAPALIGGLYWRRGHRRGVVCGLVAGFALWFYTLMLPAYAGEAVLISGALAGGPFGIAWLHPEALFGFQVADPLTHGVVVSLGANIALYVGVSLIARSGVVDRVQAAAFVTPHAPRPAATDIAGDARVGDLKALVERCLGADKTADAFAAYALVAGRTYADRDPVDTGMVEFAEAQLARVLGASSARLLVGSALSDARMPIEDVVALIDETSQKIQFNRDLLETALENISQGVSVVDRDLRLVAWNSRYLELFDYPSGFIYVGRPIADAIRFNAERGECGPGAVDQHVRKRLDHLRAGKPHSFERVRSDGTVLKILGNPMPGGGYVQSFTDITENKRIEQALQEANEQLEQRVIDRTRALSDANAALKDENDKRLAMARDLEAAIQLVEQATASKTRFLAAASHDLLQPLNAARLFTSALAEEVRDGRDGGERPGAAELLANIDRSITSADRLLKALLDISKLDAGGLVPDVTDFPVDALMAGLVTEFSVIAERKGVRVGRVPCSLSVRSDRALLQSVLQNLMSNAVRYTRSGRVLIGCRRRGAELAIEVWDTGCGIPENKRDQIFEEFCRLRSGTSQPDRGLGLGLAITDRIIRLLGHRLELRSAPGRGSVFRVFVPQADGVSEVAAPRARAAGGGLTGLHVLCIDNEPQVQAALEALLTRWGCRARTASDGAAALDLFPSTAPDVVLLDHHLDHGETGLDVLDRLAARWGVRPPAILITADRGSAVQTAAEAAGVPILNKPVQPATLRALLVQMTRPAAAE